MSHRSRIQNRRLREGGVHPLDHNARVAFRKAQKRYAAALRRLNQSIRGLGRAATISATQMRKYEVAAAAWSVAGDTLRSHMSSESA